METVNQPTKLKTLFEMLRKEHLELKWGTRNDLTLKQANAKAVRLRKLVFSLAEEGQPLAKKWLEDNYGLHIFSKKEVTEWQRTKFLKNSKSV